MRRKLPSVRVRRTRSKPRARTETPERSTTAPSAHGCVNTRCRASGHNSSIDECVRFGLRDDFAHTWCDREGNPETARVATSRLRAAYAYACVRGARLPRPLARARGRHAQGGRFAGRALCNFSAAGPMPPGPGSQRQRARAGRGRRAGNLGASASATQPQPIAGVHSFVMLSPSAERLEVAAPGEPLVGGAANACSTPRPTSRQGENLRAFHYLTRKDQYVYYFRL